MNIVYNASAGTGKTYQVTHLYEQLVLEKGIDPRKILLMTFTDNAAAELRMRVSHRLLKARRTAENDGDMELEENAICALARLPSAAIGTIHSFCSRLLREHALEAGLSPGFSTLAGDERDELLNQICRDELLARLISDPDFKTFCSGVQMIGSGGGFGTSITETVPGLISQAGSLGISLEAADDLLPAPQAAGSISAFALILEQMRELPKLTADAQQVFQCLEEQLPIAESIDALGQVLSSAGLKKFGRGKGHKPISDDFWELLGAVEDAQKYKTRFPAARAFARYVQAVAIQFRQRKHAMDAVDFDDQLQMAAALLHAGTATPEFEYVIVDEVQDTSRIQYNLIKSLWSSDTQLIICGDKKQSIYTWRGADPQVMPDLETAIQQSENHTLENLKTSYRSKAPILDVVNALFKSVYGNESYSEDSHLEPNPEFDTADEKACVEFLAPDAELDDCVKRDKITAEMEAVANRIQLLIKGSAAWQPAFRYSDGFAPTSPDNAYRYSDILILLRRTTHQSTLEQALRHAGIPYTLGGKGRGLFTRQETRDISLFLNVVINPADAYSLIGFLRSPWIGLSDETIAELAWNESGFSVDRLLSHFNDQQPMPSEQGAAARDLILRYRALLATKLASELVRLLIDETGFDAMLAGLTRGTQRLANLRKILDWLRENERGAQTTPAAVIRKLAEHIKNPPQIPEAALLDPAQNAVTLMTVHGSKGLTKRVVIIPDISFRPDADRNFTRVFLDTDQRPTLGLKITAPDKSSVTSPGFKAANTRDRDVRSHELKNLFYVAMTRARDLVITSATRGKKPEGWLSQLAPFIGNEIPAIPYSTLQDAVQNELPAPGVLNIHIPDPDQLTAALATLPPPPESPTLQRIPATRLAKELDEQEPLEREPGKSAIPANRAAALGSLGHAVLEQLALNSWEGSVTDWLEKLRDEFSISRKEAATLSRRIEHTHALMQELTADMTELRPELPFVLHEGDRLIDGTIDLLCRNSDVCSIFDYKFTTGDDHTVAATYRGQMTIYRKAAQCAYPTLKKIDLQLIVIDPNKARLVSI